MNEDLRVEDHLQKLREERMRDIAAWINHAGVPKSMHRIQAFFHYDDGEKLEVVWGIDSEPGSVDLPVTARITINRDMILGAAVALIGTGVAVILKNLFK